MVVLRIEIHLRLHAARSLKDKRLVVQSVKQRLRNKFNVAVAEVGSLDRWRDAELGVVSVGSDRRIVDAELESITRYLDSDARFEMVERHVEYH
jgi:uncharacterized protein YlxP (DUF503 family)